MIATYSLWGAQQNDKVFSGLQLMVARVLTSSTFYAATTSGYPFKRKQMGYRAVPGLRFHDAAVGTALKSSVSFPSCPCLGLDAEHLPQDNLSQAGRQTRTVFVTFALLEPACYSLKAHFVALHRTEQHIRSASSGNSSWGQVFREGCTLPAVGQQQVWFSRAGT